MKLAFCGLPGSGKSTIFSALTHRRLHEGRGREESNQALLPLPDERVDRLSELFSPDKTIHAQVNYVDPAPPVAKPDDPTTRLPTELRQAEGLIEVVRNFDGGFGPPNPKNDHHIFQEEALLNDLITVERRLERIAMDRRRGRKGDPEEITLLEEAQDILSNESPLRIKPEFGLNPKLRGFGLLSSKPVIVVSNNDDDNPSAPDLSTDTPVVVIRAQIEAELAELGQEEREEFAADYGITESALDRLIAASYRSLNLISFFTIGKDEVRAWTIKNGSSALDAAGTVHTDLQKGFIRAEVMRWEDLLEHGSEAALKKAGLMKVVGKDHIVHDGDIVHIRFNV